MTFFNYGNWKNWYLIILCHQIKLLQIDFIIKLIFHSLFRIFFIILLLFLAKLKKNKIKNKKKTHFFD